MMLNEMNKYNQPHHPQHLKKMKVFYGLMYLIPFIGTNFTQNNVIKFQRYLLLIVIWHISRLWYFQLDFRDNKKDKWDNKTMFLA